MSPDKNCIESSSKISISLKNNIVQPQRDERTLGDIPLDRFLPIIDLIWKSEIKVTLGTVPDLSFISALTQRRLDRQCLSIQVHRRSEFIDSFCKDAYNHVLCMLKQCRISVQALPVYSTCYPWDRMGLNTLFFELHHRATHPGCLEFKTVPISPRHKPKLPLFIERWMIAKEPTRRSILW